MRRIPVLLTTTLFASMLASAAAAQPSPSAVSVSMAYDEAVFDLGVLAGEKDEIPPVIFDGIGVLDWPSDASAT